VEPDEAIENILIRFSREMLSIDPAWPTQSRPVNSISKAIVAPKTKLIVEAPTLIDSPPRRKAPILVGPPPAHDLGAGIDDLDVVVGDGGETDCHFNVDEVADQRRLGRGGQPCGHDRGEDNRKTSRQSFLNDHYGLSLPCHNPYGTRRRSLVSRFE
jgi:hypothetical protein